jgi:hypothetical protein
MRASIWSGLAALICAFGAVAHTLNDVDADVFDPKDTDLVGARWVNGIGCPTGEKTFDGTTTTPFTDPACPTGDRSDHNNAGLLLAKTGPTANFAAAGADLKGLKGATLTELGYDIRFGSHCGAGAPRFDIATDDGKFFFVGCSSPHPTTAVQGFGFARLRWGGSAPLLGFNRATGALEPITGRVKSISIVFDEGQDTSSATDFTPPESKSGLAVIDNIDVNGRLIGR